MPYFYILRIQREDSPDKPSAECQVKFFPIFTGFQGVPIRVFAETESAALASAIQSFPTLRRFLAIQECTSYDRTITNLIKARLTRGLFGRAETARVGTVLKGTSGVSVVAGDCTIPSRSKRRPDENPVEAEPAV